MFGEEIERAPRPATHIAVDEGGGFVNVMIEIARTDHHAWMEILNSFGRRSSHLGVFMVFLNPPYRQPRAKNLRRHK